ncbi:MAG: FixH family protein [Gammaproteobacteria bacterium]|nr:FixH family protein [Gammaproteobacteria bacterium]
MNTEHPLSDPAGGQTPRSSPAGPRRSHPLREPLVWLVLLIPASAVLMGVVMIALSISSWDGLVADDYYRRGLEINRTLARDAEAARLDVRARLELDPAAGTVALQLDGNERFRAPPAVNLRLFHATRAGLDRHLVLPADVAALRYRGDGLSFAEGRWYLQLDADEWRLTGALAAPDRRRVVHLAPRT